MGRKQKPNPHLQQRQKKKEPQMPHEELPIDILHEILVRCPVKTICKFRSVSKKWCSLVSDPFFQQDHFSRSQHNPLLLKTRCELKDSNDTKTNTLHLSTYNNGGTLINNFSKTGLQQCPYSPTQSCQGLVCIGAMYHEAPILLCNPSTEEMTALPSTKGKLKCLGFGYAASTNEFKVVRFFEHPEVDEIEELENGAMLSNQETEVCCEIFVLGTNKWREARSPPPHWPNSLMSGAPFLHGALHLVERDHYHDKDPCIHVFNIVTEVYTEIPFPEYYHTVEESLMSRVYLREMGGLLCLVLDFRTSLEFWCLRDYHNRKWVKEYSLDLSSFGPRAWVEPLQIMVNGRMMLSSFGPRAWVEPLQIMVNGRMMLNAKIKGVKSLCYYNFQTKSFSDHGEEGCSGIYYVESFLP